MKSSFYSLLLALFVFSSIYSYSQSVYPEYCGDGVVANFIPNGGSSGIGTLTVGNDDENLYLTYEAAAGWDFYSNASFVGQLSNVPYYGLYNFHYYNNVVPNNLNTAVIPKADISMDENDCFIVSAFVYAVNPSSGFSGNVWAILSYDPIQGVHYADYCWQECDSKIEITGMGVIDLPVATLTFNDVASIKKIRVEAIYKDNAVYNGPVEFSNALGDVYQVEPESGILNYDRHGDGLPLPLENKVYFTALFNQVDEFGITLNQLNNAGSVHSFIAYVYREVPEGSSPSILEYHRVFIYRNNEFPEPCASNYPTSTPLGAYEFDIALPITTNPKTITLSVPITELADDLRNGFILVTAGNVTELREFVSYDVLGESLLIETITLTGVPGEVDHVSLKIWSPCDEDHPGGGDSFFTSAVLMDYTEEYCYPCDGQMSALTLEYLGSASDATVKVYSKKVEDDKLIATFTNVNLGDELSFVGTGNQNKMGPKIRITINDENNNYTEIHTSCSEPIGIGMVFSNKSGSEQTFKILDGESAYGGPICPIGNPGPDPCGPCEGQVTALTLKYLGPEDDVTIKIFSNKIENEKLIAEFIGVDQNDELSFIGIGKHNQMGAKIRIVINDDYGNYTEIHTSCSEPIGVGMIFDNLFEIMAGASKDGGALCETGGGNGGGEPCGPCEGQMTSLTLEYLGDESDATIRVYQNKVGDKNLLATFTGINNGDEITFTGTGKHSKLGAKVRITINEEMNNYTEIHTSCSQPIAVGMTYWDKLGTTENFLLTAGTSHEGGDLCEETQKSGNPLSTFEIDELTLDQDVIKPEFKVYPNPVNSYSNVEFVVSETGSVQLELINFYGKTVKQLYNETCIAGAHYVIKLNAQDIPTGMYLVRLIKGNEVLQQKIQVIR